VSDQSPRRYYYDHPLAKSPVFGEQAAPADDTESARADAEVVRRFRLLSNCDKLKFIDRANEAEAFAVYSAPVGRCDGFCRAYAESRLETLAARAKAAIVAAKISKGSE